MLTVNKFCGCFELESGGLFIGWLGIVTKSIVSIFSMVAIFGLSIVSCAQIENALVETGEKPIADEGCSAIKTIGIVILVVIILFMIGFIVIDSLLIKGTKKRNHVLIRPTLILHAIGIFLHIVSGILSFTPKGIISAIFYTVLNGYIFVCLYSLYVKIRDEKQGGNVQYDRPNKNVA